MTDSAEKIQQLATEYMAVVQAVQQELLRMTRTRVDTGHFPEDSEAILMSLHRKGNRLSIRMLRLRADMLEAGLVSPFEGTSIPDHLPDGLPENW